MTGNTPNCPAHAALGETDSRFVDVAALPWTEIGPGMRVKWLYKDDAKQEALGLFHADPGAVIPDHVHQGFEQTFILEGAMEDDDGVCTAGNFVWRPPGSRHTARLPNGGRYLVFFSGQARSVATGRLFPAYGEEGAAAG